MRWLFRLLGAAALCCVLMAVPAACGSRHAKSVSGGLKPVVSLSGFTIAPGHTYRVWFAVDAGQLKMIAIATDDAPNHTATAPLHGVLEKVQAGWDSQGSPLVAVPLDEYGHPSKNQWLIAFETHAPLTDGWYRLTLSGRCRIASFSVVEL